MAISSFVRLSNKDPIINSLQENVDRVFRSIKNEVVMVNGKPDGQTIAGGLSAGESLFLSSTTNTTKGSIFFGSNSLYDEANDRLGIGTTSPAHTLEVNSTGFANINVHSTTINTLAHIEVGTGGTGNRYAYIDFVGDDTYTDYGLRVIRKNTGANADSSIEHMGTGSLNLFNHHAGDIAFYTSASRRMTITNDGDVGIGTDSPAYTLEVNSAGSTVINVHSTTSGGPSVIELGRGSSTDAAAYIDFTSQVGANYSSRIYRYAGVNGPTDFRHKGTGDFNFIAEDTTNIPFYIGGSEKMRVHNDGKVGIGTSSPSQALEVVNATNTKVNIHSTNSGEASSIEIGKGGSGNRYAYIDFNGDDSVQNTDYALRIVRTNGGQNADSQIIHRGTNDFSLIASDAADITFKTSDTERAVVKSSGRVGIGITEPGYRLDVKDNVSGYVTRFFNDGDNAGNAGIIIRCGKDDGTGGTVYLLAQDGDGTGVGYLENSSGGVFGIIDISDETVKSDVAPTKVSGLDVIKKIDPIEYRYTKHGPKGRLNKCGFSAQNLQQAFPEAVSAHPDTNLLGVSRSALIPVLVKGMREQQDQIDTLEQKINILEQKIEALKPTKTELKIDVE